jgi:hypothetical protein
MSPFVIQQVTLSVESPGTYVVTPFERRGALGPTVMRFLVSLERPFPLGASIAVVAFGRFLLPLEASLFACFVRRQLLG